MDILQNTSSFMQEIYNYFLGIPYALNISFFFCWLICGFIAARLLRKAMSSIERTKRIPTQVCGMVGKICVTGSWFVFITMALSAIGVNVTSILGAAGVLGMAIGFASQTSLSNVICGIFIVTERSIKLGDFISVDGCEGTVESINLLSVQLRKIDNSLIRVPNQSLIQNPMTNITGSTMRRCDFDLGLDYQSDLEQVKQELQHIIAEQKLFLQEPAASILFLNFGDSTLNIRVGAWCKTADYAQARYAFAHAILTHFTAKNISMAYPTRTIYTAGK